MSLRTIFLLVLAGFLLLCAGLIVDSGFLRTTHASVHASTNAVAAQTRGQGAILLQQTAEVPPPVPAAKPPEPNQPQPAAPQLQPPAISLGAEGGPRQEITLGSTDKSTKFKYQLVLDSLGAGIRTATFSEYDTRDSKEHEPLVFLSPVQVDGRTILSMANGALTAVNQRQRLRLDQLSWRSLGLQNLPNGGQAASFEATIVSSENQPVLKLTKTFRIQPDTYLLECTFTSENLTSEKQTVQYEMTGAAGLEYEGLSTDMRKAVAAFRTPQGQVSSFRLDAGKLSKATTPEARSLNARNAGEPFLWAAAVNRYFAAIVVPVPADPNGSVDWIKDTWGTYYDPSGRRDPRQSTVGLQLASTEIALNPAGQPDSARSFPFNTYIGPKDKGIFDKNPDYRKLGFVQTIDFMGCCCFPMSIISPLAFGILAIMKWMYFVIPNYGVVIIILVLLMRLVLHPVTRYSQVSMSKMSELAPRAEEIKKKYGNSKAEMNKKLMELYREQGASPIMGRLPMFVQIPIWVALWSAIYTSIALRGAAFLPFWITDLSAPDSVLTWPPITIPLFGWQLQALNLLPILMGVAFYLQQKIMPMQPPASAATNPQMAQQQKIMNIMLPLMMPVFLYNAPSGVNLYIMASTFGGVVEQYFIKKHIQEKKELEAQGLISATSKTGGKIKRKKPKPFFRFK